MDIERIENHIKASIRNNTTIKIHFRGRLPVTGLFIKGNDYNELKAKNFWRVVNASQLTQWQQTKDLNCSKIFNGASFTSLASTGAAEKKSMAVEAE